MTLARQIGCTPDEAEQFFGEVESSKVCDMSRDGHGIVTLESRRRAKELGVKDSARLRKRRERERKAGHADVTPPRARAQESESESESKTESKSKPPSVRSRSNGSGLDQSEDSRQVGGRSPAGSRLAPDWTLPTEWREWAEAEGHPDPRGEAERFRDYWHGKAGKDGRKVDWFATWRNWVRRSREFSSGRSRDESSIDQMKRLKREGRI